MGSCRTFLLALAADFRYLNADDLIYTYPPKKFEYGLCRPSGHCRLFPGLILFFFLVCQESCRLFGERVQQCCPGACTHSFDSSYDSDVDLQVRCCRLSFLFSLSKLVRTALPIRGQNKILDLRESEMCFMYTSLVKGFGHTVATQRGQG